MKILPHVHLTYCLNVHPGETLADIEAAITGPVRKIRALLNVQQSFGIGLRLSAVAANELLPRLEAFKALLKQEGCYVFTINGFPFGTFHGEAVKEMVYAPDWRTHDRYDYTCKLADILAELLPDGVTGSISTVPGSYAEWVQSYEEMEEVQLGIVKAATYLAALKKQTGCNIILALEPEPDCLLDHCDNILPFFDELDDLATVKAMKHIGLCFDTAHAAVAFEDPTEALLKIQDAGINIAKIQVSSALIADETTCLEPFAEGVYLHQTRCRDSDGELEFFPDLPEALASGLTAQWRTHFHVPLYFERNGPLSGSAPELQGAFAELLASGICPHLEIETYTFNVFPKDFAIPDLPESIAAEYRWLLDAMSLVELVVPE